MEKFIDIFKHLNYLDIISTSLAYPDINNCDDIWDYVLKNKLYYDGDISVFSKHNKKELCDIIYKKHIKHAEKFYRIFDMESLMELCLEQTEYLYGIKYLINTYNIDPSLNSNQAFNNAIITGHYNIVNYMLNDDRIEPEINNGIALRIAIQNKYTDIAKLLIEDNRFSIDILDACLKIACVTDELDIIKCILNNNQVDPVGYNNKPIKIAIKLWNTKIINYLLSYETVRDNLQNEDPQLYQMIKDNIDLYNLIGDITTLSL